VSHLLYEKKKNNLKKYFDTIMSMTNTMNGVNPLNSFLRKFINYDSSVKSNFVSSTGGSYYISERDDLDTFYKLICETNENEDTMDSLRSLNLLERPNKYSKLNIDIDIQDYKYTDDDLLFICKTIKEVIRDLFEIDIKGIYIFEKIGYIKNDKYKRGLHLQVVNFICDSDSRRIVLEILNKKIKTYNEKMIIDIIPNNFWLMYGACKSIESGVYRTIRTYDSSNNKFIDTNKYIISNNIKIFDFHFNEINVNENNVEYYYPIIFKINSTSDCIYDIKNREKCKVNKETSKVSEANSSYEDFNEEDFEMDDVYERIENIIGDDFNIGEINENGFINCKRLRPSACIIPEYNDDIHNKVNVWVKIFSNNKMIMGCCHPDHNKKHITIN
jgi:hypothetical protein